ncbi:hypothetical protein ACFL6S_34755, partial [Candidatus Poribacteria bacterium]
DEFLHVFHVLHEMSPIYLLAIYLSVLGLPNLRLPNNLVFGFAPDNSFRHSLSNSLAIDGRSYRTEIIAQVRFSCNLNPCMSSLWSEMTYLQDDIHALGRTRSLSLQ